MEWKKLKKEKYNKKYPGLIKASSDPVIVFFFQVSGGGQVVPLEKFEY